jgi:hypothetical protein
MKGIRLDSGRIRHAAPFPNAMYPTLVGLLVLGCHHAPGPREVASNYLRAEFSDKLAEAYGYLSTDDQSVKTLGEYSVYDTVASSMDEAFVNQVSVSVDSILEQADTATVVASVIHPDFSAVMGDLFSTALASVFTGDTGKIRQELADALKEKYAGKPLPTTTTIDTIDLLREGTGCRHGRDCRRTPQQTRP